MPTTPTPMEPTIAALPRAVDVGSTGAPPQVEGYHSLERIGRGGLGDVYRAVQSSTGATVAIKVLRDVSDSSLAWHRTRRELTALVALGGHAHVVQPIELLELDAGPALVVEFAPGGSVADLVRWRRESGVVDAPTPGGLSVDETVFVGRQTASALEAAHERGIVHRDVKPQNLLIDAYGQIKLCDFGIAALTADDEYRTRTNAVSMRYTSPEDLELDHEVGPSSDVYSLGATLIDLVRGAPPSLKERLAPWVAPETPDVALAALDRVVARCLHPNPTVRPTASALRQALDGLAFGAGVDRIDGLPIVASPGGSPAIEVPADSAATDQPGRVYRPAKPAEAVPAAAQGAVPAAVPADPPIDREATTRNRRAPSVAQPPTPRVARPAPKSVGSGRRIAAFAIAALGLAAVGVTVAWLALGFGDRRAGDGPAAATTPSTVADAAVAPSTAPRPSGLAPLDGADWTAGAVGDCLAQRDQPALVTVPCEEPHDLQRFAVGTLDQPEAFDAAGVQSAVEEACRAVFPGFVGSSPDASALSIAAVKPSAATWASGGRGYQCFVGIPGVRLVGDARTSGW